jgi:hypothetical protein
MIKWIESSEINSDQVEIHNKRKFIVFFCFTNIGTIRIGLDIGGGSATFAAWMSECNVMIVTTSMNFDGPFNSFIASRGLIPMHISVAYRLPFFDNTLDIVHSMHVLTTGYLIRCYNFTLYAFIRC